MSYTSYLNDRAWRLRSFFTQLSRPVDAIIEMEECAPPSHRHALLYGGCGALGSKCIFDLKNASWWVACVDFVANTHADVNIIILREEEATTQEANVQASLRSVLGQRKLDLVFCTAGGFQPGGLEDDLVKTSVEMWKDHVEPATIAASIASALLKPHGLFVLTSALLAVKPRADMVAYSVAQSAVIHLAKCLATEGSGMPAHSTVICLLPLRLDTAKTRSLNRHMDVGTFTPLQFVSDLLMGWLNKKELPLNGSLCQLLTNNFNTDCIITQ